MKLPSRLEGALLIASALLAGCGGGGGDPGTCHGSPEVCAEGQASTTGTNQTSGTPSTGTTGTGTMGVGGY